jgi:hypothetical protein
MKEGLKSAVIFGWRFGETKYAGSGKNIRACVTVCV